MRILLAIDDSKYSAAATRMLVGQYDPKKTTVRVLHVVELLAAAFYPELTPPFPSTLGEVQKGRLKAGRELARQTAGKIRAAGFRVDSIVREGSVRPTVVDVATKWRADLIVLGSHGRTGMTRLLLGSVSEYVVRHAGCSVEIVRTKTK